MLRRLLCLGFVTVAAITLGATRADAWSVSGNVYCDVNSNGAGDVNVDTPLANVKVTVLGGLSALTDAAGFYSIDLPDLAGNYLIEVTAPNGSLVVFPASNPYPISTTDTQHQVEQHFLLTSAACAPPPPPPPPEQKCWLTGGGAKFDLTAGILVAEHGPKHSFGGNVNPGCSADAGDGGSWNHVAHSLKLHFHGQHIEVVKCGNVSGIPPGSTSPVTPYNFIEFRGTGTLKGIKGNKADYGVVSFYGRAEDRNEPGSAGQRDGAGKDRYFLNVWDSTLTTRLLIDLDGDPNTIDPVTITDGNLQLHISSCDKPPVL
jgi:hypothetical protein